MPPVWSLSAVKDGLRVRAFGPGGHGRTAFETAEDTQPRQRADLALWATRYGALVVRVPGTPERPAIVVDPERGTGTVVPALPSDVRFSATSVGFHADVGENGVLTFVETAEPSVVWRLPVDAATWEPAVCPSGFVATAATMRADRLLVGGHRFGSGLLSGVPAIVERARSGDVFDDLPIGTSGWKKRDGPVTGTFFGVHVGPGGTPVVAVNPRLYGPEDDAVDIWLDGRWTRFAEWVTTVDVGPHDVALFFRDGWMRTWAEERWSEAMPLPIDKPLRGVARRASTVVVADSRRISLSTDGGRTYATVAEAEPGEDFYGVALGADR